MAGANQEELHGSKSPHEFVLSLIGWKSGAFFTNQSQGLTTQNQSNVNYFLLDGLWKQLKVNIK